MAGNKTGRTKHRAYSSRVSMGELATRFGVAKQQVWSIVNRKTWNHIWKGL